MSRGGRFPALLAAALLAAARAAAATDWGGWAHGGQPFPAGDAPALAALSASRALLVAGRTDADGRQRLYAWQTAGAEWTAVGGAAPVDGTPGRDTRGAVLAADGAGRAAVVYAGFAGDVWRLYAGRFDGVSLAPLNGGAPVDRGTGGNASGAAAAYLAGGRLLLALTQYDGARTALFVRGFDGAAWSDLNGGQPLDDATAGWSEAPSLAAAPDGGAAVAWIQGGRLEVIRFDGTRWSRLPAGAQPDGTRGAASPAAVFLADGSLLVAALREGAGGVQRLYASRWDGAGWQDVNGGAPLDADPEGVVALAAARDGADAVQLAYVATDQRDGILPSVVRAVRVAGLASVPVNGGDALNAAGAAPAAVAVAAAAGAPAGWLAVAAGGTGVAVRQRDPGPAAAPAAVRAAAGVHASGAVLRPGRGDAATIRIGLDRAQQVRAAVYSLAGAPVKVLADRAAAGDLALAWDGRDEANNLVAPGVYLLVTRAETFRDTTKLVVIR